MRDAITTALEVAGILALVAAVGVSLWPVSAALALACVGVCLLGSSAIVMAHNARGGRTRR